MQRFGLASAIFPALAITTLMLARAGAARVTLESLLGEMVDPDAVARWPSPAFTCVQASSYDRASVGPDKPGWFANNDGSNYLRDETHDGRREQVMMDADGPGAIVRIQWTNGDLRPARVRFYLDGANEPALDWSTAEIPSTVLNLGPPLLTPNPPPTGHAGYSLYLPIAYAKHCKVTLEEADPAKPTARYYHVNYRTYAGGTEVESFTREALAAARPTIERVGTLLEHPPSRTTETHADIDTTLAPGAEAAVDLPNGAAALRELSLSVGVGLSPAACEQALRSVVIRASFDDEADAIWCPVGDFFGSGAGGRPLASWYRDVDEHGASTSRWTMPYRQRAKLTLTNLGGIPVVVKLKAAIGPWTWDDRSLYFHCSWRQQTQIPTRPARDWNFVSVAGRGVLVGDVMSVFNPVPAWYGEGDEKIWIDGEAFPSHFGTGTEDYYDASWAPNTLYQTPFANHVRMDDPLSQGQNVYTRSRNLDTVPFTKSLKFDFEILTWKESTVDYATTTYWYGSPGASANVKAAPEEARRPVPVLPAPRVIQSAAECESLAIVNRSPDLVTESQDMRWATAGQWSANAHLLVKARKVGDFVELAIPVTGDTPRRVTLYATCANDYGIVRFSLNGKTVADNDFDGYAENPRPSGPISLGVVEPKDGRIVLRAELVGTNAMTRGDRYYAGLDAVVVSEK